MPRNDLVDRIVVEEFGVFASDPLGYTADRERGIESLVNDGVDKKEAREVWTEFSRRFLTTGDGGTTLSAHGLDRARSLGENVAVDDETRAEIYEALRDADGTSNRKKLHEKVGASEDEFDQSLWTLRRRGIVETHTYVYTDEVTVSLTEPEKADSR